MQRLICLISFTIILFGCSEKKNDRFIVSGKIKNSNSKTVYLEETAMTSMQRLIKDSTVVGSGGEFLLKTTTLEEGIYNLRMGGESVPFASLISDAKKIVVNVDFQNGQDLYTVEGSDASKTLRDFLFTSGSMIRNIYGENLKIDSLAGSNKEKKYIDSIILEKENSTKQLKKYTRQLITHSKSAALSMFLLATYQGVARNPNFSIEAFGIEELQIVLADLIKKFPEHSAIATVKNSIDEQSNKSAWIGKLAPEISLPDTEGNEIKLSSFRGKYVLVDFWASWCGPCRTENPNVVEAYKEFKNKNFTILGVSLDQNKAAWIKAIVQDQLNWKHISDLKMWGSEVVSLYHIEGIPFNVLVDSEGIIIAENLRGDQLKLALAKALK